jgi:hypothetical protein
LMAGRKAQTRRVPVAQVDDPGSGESTKRDK